MMDARSIPRLVVLVALGAGSAPTLAGNDLDPPWRYTLCATRFNPMIGVADYTHPVMVACANLKARQIDVLNARSEVRRAKACAALHPARMGIELEKAKSGLRWFGDYVCSDDCSGHKAGYSWAEGRRVRHQSDCPSGESESFREGCLQYAREVELHSFEREHCTRGKDTFNK